jgi:hypothetical protein
MGSLAMFEDLEAVSPFQCTLVVGIGLVDSDVELEEQVTGTMAHLRRGRTERGRSFARDAPHVLDVIADVGAMGARVLASSALDCEPADLYSLCDAARSSRVLIFLTHHHPRWGLQLGPRMIPWPAIAKAISPEFDGVVDLSACNTATIAVAAESGGSHANWVGFKGDQRLDFRASVVRAVQRSLLAQRAPYLETLGEVLQEFTLQSQELK